MTTEIKGIDVPGDSLNVKVIAHITGMDEVVRCYNNTRLQLEQLDRALKNLNVELEVD